MLEIPFLQKRFGRTGCRSFSTNYTNIYIYIYIERERERKREGGGGKILGLYFTGCDLRAVEEKNIYKRKV